MLNGVAMSTRGWYRNLPELQPGYDVLLYDYLGQGRSSQEDEPYTIDHFAEYLVRIMDALGIERIHPVGVSYGGFIAAELGRLFQDRLHTLTLSGILLTRETQFQMYQDLSLLFYRSPDPAFEIYTHYMYEKIFGEAFASRLYGDKLQRMRQGFFDDYHGKEYCLIRLTEAQNPFFERIDADPDAYRGIRTPTLILTGDQDRAIPPWQQAKLLEILPNARQIMVPGSGHMTYMERPDMFWPAVRAFLAAKAIVWCNCYQQASNWRQAMYIGDYLGRRQIYSPDKLAIIDAGKTPALELTYRQMNERANRLANWLRDVAGVQKGDRVAILARDGVEHLDLFYACGKLGAIHTPFNWRLHWRELAGLIELTRPTALVFSDEFKEAVAQIKLSIGNWELSIVNGGADSGHIDN